MEVHDAPDHPILRRGSAAIVASSARVCAPKTLLMGMPIRAPRSVQRTLSNVTWPQYATRASRSYNARMWGTE